jgi:hypothetical protein
LIEFERQRDPAASELVLLDAVMEGLEKDRR